MIRFLDETLRHAYHFQEALSELFKAASAESSSPAVLAQIVSWSEAHGKMIKFVRGNRRIRTRIQ